jgi:hypothetical protein
VEGAKLTCHVPNPMAGISAPVFSWNLVLLYPAIVLAWPEEETCREICDNRDEARFSRWDNIMIAI